VETGTKASVFPTGEKKTQRHVPKMNKERENGKDSLRTSPREQGFLNRNEEPHEKQMGKKKD